MSNSKWRRKTGSDPKSDDTAEAVWGDDDAGEADAPPTAASADPAADTESRSDTTSTDEPSHGDADQDSLSTGRVGEPAVPPPPPGDIDTPALVDPVGPSTPTDEFDAVGAEIAEVLRHSREVAGRARAEAEEHARALTADAEQQAQATMVEAEQQARDHRAEADREIEQQRAEVARHLDEAASTLEAAQERDRTLRGAAEQHLAESVAARDAATAMLEQAAERLARAETVAQDLAAQVEAARLEVGPIAMELQELSEQYGALVVAEKSATANGGTRGEAAVIDLREAPTPPANDSDDASAAEPGAGEDADGVGPSKAEGEPPTPSEAAEQK